MITRFISVGRWKVGALACVLALALAGCARGDDGGATGDDQNVTEGSPGPSWKGL